jgi:hypothetical protein
MDILTCIIAVVAFTAGIGAISGALAYTQGYKHGKQAIKGPKKGGLAICCGLLPLLLVGQPAPRWLDGQWREQTYPAAAYLTAFVSETAVGDEPDAHATARMEQDVKRKIAESIAVRVKSTETVIEESLQATATGDQYAALYLSTIETFADATLTGLKAETFFDRKKRVRYAFACVNKQELTRYCAATVATQIEQAKSRIEAARGAPALDKTRLRKQYTEAARHLTEAARAQAVLTAFGRDAYDPTLRYDEWNALNNETIQALEQTTLTVYVAGHEDLFGKTCAVVADKLKTTLTQKGCTLTDNERTADYTLRIQAATRAIGNAADPIVFCYADVAVTLRHNPSQTTVYHDERSLKGGSTGRERAGREALNEAADEIAADLRNLNF